MKGSLEHQLLLLSYLISSHDLFIKVSPILNKDYFDVKLKGAITFIKSYFDTYKAPPTAEQVRVETGQVVEARPNFTKQEILYAEAELESFCKNRAMEEAIFASVPLAKAGKYGEVESIIRAAITVSLQRNIGLDYFAEPELRLKQLSLSNAAIPTGWFSLDENLNGGLNRKEMIIFAAPPGVGKSITLSNLAKNLAKRGLHGVYVTLELSEEIVAKRFDSMFSGISQSELLRNITKASIEISKQGGSHGRIFIKRMPESSTNANHIRAYLKEFEIVNGFTPDFIVVDYLDLMCSVQSISAENTFIRDKFISEELRAIANEYNLIMATASQLNRGALTLDRQGDVSQAHIAGGISKVNTADNVVAISQNPQQKARGELHYKLLKTRSSGGVGNEYILKFNPSTLLIENMDERESPASNKSISSYIKSKQGPTGPSGSGGLDPNSLPFRL